MKVRVAYDKSLTRETIMLAIVDVIWHKREVTLLNQWKSIVDRRNGYYGEIVEESFMIWRYPVSMALYPGYVNHNHILLSGRLSSNAAGSQELKLEASLNSIGKAIVILASILMLFIVFLISANDEYSIKNVLIPMMLLMIPAVVSYFIIRIEMKSEIAFFLSDVDKKITIIP